eukprot:COSAG03_NODE_969_length_5160_cov_31.898241_4_plen_489_part_01
MLMRQVAPLLLVELGVVASSEPALAPVGPPPPPPAPRLPGGGLLPATLHIDWELLPPMPVGTEGNSGGFLDAETLVYVFGLSGSSYPAAAPDAAFAINVSEPASTRAWARIPFPPGPARLCGGAAVVNGALFVLGGFTYGAGYQGYRDGYKLTRPGAPNENLSLGWKWEPIPALPFGVSYPGVVALQSKLYVMGGAWEEYKTGSDTSPPNIGAKSLVLDTENMGAGWQVLPELPGVPRAGPTTVANGRIYRMGGNSGGADAKPFEDIDAVDCWEYAPLTRVWSRLPDLPISNGGSKLNGDSTFMDRYIIMIGGCQCPGQTNGSKTIGKPYGVSSKMSAAECGVNTTEAAQECYSNDVFVFDTELRTWSTITAAAPRSPELMVPACGLYPANNARPQISVHGDLIASVGGEAIERRINGHTYSHDSDFAVLGRIRLKLDDHSAALSSRLMPHQLTWLGPAAYFRTTSSTTTTSTKLVLNSATLRILHTTV